MLSFYDGKWRNTIPNLNFSLFSSTGHLHKIIITLCKPDEIGNIWSIPTKFIFRYRFGINIFEMSEFLRLKFMFWKKSWLKLITLRDEWIAANHQLLKILILQKHQIWSLNHHFKKLLFLWFREKVKFGLTFQHSQSQLIGHQLSGS